MSLVGNLESYLTFIINCCVEREGTIFPPHLLKLGWELDLNLLKRILFLKIQYFCFLHM